jgi:hypothetical protein
MMLMVRLSGVLCMNRRDSGSSVHICPKHPFCYAVDGHRFSLRVTNELVIIDIHYLIFGGYLLVSSLGFKRCKE